MNQERPEAHNLVCRHHIALAQLYIDRSDGAHCIKSSSLELEQCTSVRGGALCKNADWIVLLVIVFDCTLSIGDLLDNSVTRRLVRASIDEEALEATTGSAEQGRILVVNRWSETWVQW